MRPAPCALNPGSVTTIRHGKLIKADGSEFEGDFRYDVIHGAGRWKSVDGDVYEGKFVSGQVRGRAGSR